MKTKYRKNVKSSRSSRYKKKSYPSKSKSSTYRKRSGTTYKRRSAGRMKMNNTVKSKYLVTQKSAGRLDGKRLKNYTKIDDCAVKGFVQKMEFNYQFNTNRQVAYVAHSSAPAKLLAECVFKSLIKKLFMMEGKIIPTDLSNLINRSPPPPLTLFRPYKLTLSYKERDGDSTIIQDFGVTNVDYTLNSLVEEVMIWFNADPDNRHSQQFLTFELRQLERVTIADVQYDYYNERQIIDLRTLRFDIVCKSRFKVQNRTFNSENNDEADDVDRVPLYGKSFEYKTTGTTFRAAPTNNAATTGRLTTNPLTGCLPSPAAESGANDTQYKETPISQQVIGCYKTESVHLDPGSIKTSVMYENMNITFAEFMRKIIFVGELFRDDGSFNQYWIGKTRLFAFEKMINVPAGAFNEIRLITEHQIDIGCIPLVRTNYFTVPGIRLKDNLPNNAQF